MNNNSDIVRELLKNNSVIVNLIGRRLKTARQIGFNLV